MFAPDYLTYRWLGNYIDMSVKRTKGLEMGGTHIGNANWGEVVGHGVAVPACRLVFGAGVWGCELVEGPGDIRDGRITERGGSELAGAGGCERREAGVCLRAGLVDEVVLWSWG
jgi:hypothetical protein